MAVVGYNDVAVIFEGTYSINLFELISLNNLLTETFGYLCVIFEVFDVQMMMRHAAATTRYAR